MAEAWMSLRAISADASLMPVIATRAEMMETQCETLAILARERQEDLAARKAGQSPPKHPWRPDPASWAPTALFIGMVAPPVGYTIELRSHRARRQRVARIVGCDNPVCRAMGELEAPGLASKIPLHSRHPPRRGAGPSPRLQLLPSYLIDPNSVSRDVHAPIDVLAQ